MTVLDMTAARARRMTRCATRGHDWQPTPDGQVCTRCTMRILGHAEAR